MTSIVIFLVTWYNWHNYIKFVFCCFFYFCCLNPLHACGFDNHFCCRRGRFSVFNSRVDDHEKVCCISPYEHPRGLKPYTSHCQVSKLIVSVISGLYDPKKPCFWSIDQPCIHFRILIDQTVDEKTLNLRFAKLLGAVVSNIFASTKMEEDARARLTSFTLRLLQKAKVKMVDACMCLPRMANVN